MPHNTNFFGQKLVEEVELGGLEDEEDRKPLFGPVDNEYHYLRRMRV